MRKVNFKRFANISHIHTHPNSAFAHRSTVGLVRTTPYNMIQRLFRLVTQSTQVFFSCATDNYSVLPNIIFYAHVLAYSFPYVWNTCLPTSPSIPLTLSAKTEPHVKHYICNKVLYDTLTQKLYWYFSLSPIAIYVVFMFPCII